MILRSRARQIFLNSIPKMLGLAIMITTRLQSTNERSNGHREREKEKESGTDCKQKPSSGGNRISPVQTLETMRKEKQLPEQMGGS